MSSLLLSPGQFVGSYKVLRLLGRGGIAEVYLVVEPADGLQRALKVMVADDDNWARRLMREGRAQHAVQHPNLVRVFGSMSAVGRPAIVMEYVEGADLRRWLAALNSRGEWPDLSQALGVFFGVLAGVEAVHDRGWVHRDLKPSNILLALRDDRIQPKVADFGLIKDPSRELSQGEVTVAGTILGTQGYIAPEQLWALPEIDIRADVFSLGCVLYLLACRQPAYGDQDEALTFRKVLNGEYRDPSELGLDLPEAVLLAIRHALVVERKDRIPSCAALRDVLIRGRRALDELGLRSEAAGRGAPRRGAVEQVLASEATTYRRNLHEARTVVMTAEQCAALLEVTTELPQETDDLSLEMVPEEPPPPASQPPSPSPPPSPPPQDDGGTRERRRPILIRLLLLAAIPVLAAPLLLLILWRGQGQPDRPPRVTTMSELLAEPPPLEEAGSTDQQAPLHEESAVQDATPIPEAALRGAVDAPASAPREPEPRREPAAPRASPAQEGESSASGQAPEQAPTAASEPAPAAVSPWSASAPAASPWGAPPDPAPAASPPQNAPPQPELIAAPAPGRVVVTGVSQRVCLRAHSDRSLHCDAELPAGGYDVLLYTDSGAVTAGSVEIAAGGTHELRCDAAFMTCH